MDIDNAHLPKEEQEALENEMRLSEYVRDCALTQKGRQQSEE
jgi:hypothetical protein